LTAEFVKPPGLAPAATIGVAAISGPVDEEKLERGLAHLRGRGYRVREASNLRSREGFLAGPDGERAAGYRELLEDPDVDAIFFARGGYGASRILRFLDAERLRAHPKIHLGSSDLTSLFASLRRHGDLMTFYGPMVSTDMADPAAASGLDWERVLAGAAPEEHRFSLPDVLSPGTAEGPLVGGCLSLLASQCGTAESVSASGAILFWEDVGEEPYRLDRLLTQLERSDTLTGLRGMVIGSVLPGVGSDSPDRIREYLQRRFRGVPYPVAMNFPAGHCPSPRTLPLGARVRLDLAQGGALTFLEAGVSLPAAP
jgi:muramoyltetrapeptide carboxypeptidase